MTIEKQNIIEMKTTIKFLTASFFVTFFVACNSDGPEEKRKQLAEFKKQQIDISSKIHQLEKELNDTLSVSKKGSLVETISVNNASFEHFIEVHGTVEADKNIQIVPETSGLITELRVEKGQMVRKGEVLAVLNTDLLRQQIKEVETNLELAANIYNKQKNLWEQKIGTEVQFLEAKNRKSSLEVSLASLKTQLSKSYIKSPIDGEVDEVFPKIGEMASPQMPMFRVVNVGVVNVVSDVSEAHIGKFKKGDNVSVEFTAIDKEYRAKISASGQFINPNNRTFKITIKLDNPEGLLKPNMLSVVKIRDQFLKEAITVPSSIIQSDSKGTFLFAVDNDGQNKIASKAYVETGITYQGQTVISKGLKDGQEVITMGYRGLIDGEAITIDKK
jgi:membrane fusion protein, multidrug efflux system